MTDKLNQMLIDCQVHHNGIAVVHVEEFGPAALTMRVGPFAVPASVFDVARAVELGGVRRVHPNLRVIPGGA